MAVAIVAVVIVAMVAVSVAVCVCCMGCSPWDAARSTCGCRPLHAGLQASRLLVRALCLELEPHQPQLALVRRLEALLLPHEQRARSELVVAVPCRHRREHAAVGGRGCVDHGPWVRGRGG